MAEVAWTDRAVKHFREIVEYLAEHAPNRAEALADKITEAVEVLHSSPRIGRVVPDYRVEHIREIVSVRPYRIIYRIRDDLCEIVAIVDARRDLGRLFSAEDLENN